jgi:hypothetical protein
MFAVWVSVSQLFAVVRSGGGGTLVKPGWKIAYRACVFFASAVNCRFCRLWEQVQL